MSTPAPASEEGTALVGRELASAINSPELIAKHLANTNGMVRTRFPPEPNGYLHIGHAKSMNMNFELSFEKLGVPPERRQTFFRYDDTNPEAESKEYIDSLAEDVLWLGWTPNPTTFSSDYFQTLYELAVELIKRGKAYVCHQTKVDIEACRDIARVKCADPSAPGNPESPWRNTSVEENLQKFDDMRLGKYGASEVTLRLKMDMYSPNPNMWDQVAYRIKFIPHPHAGEAWVIYPTYDYTHCLVDSLEDIDYSICTLEFESRRESYYWVLEALDMYRPKVYEMSRLNMTNTLLSKRKLLKLVKNNFMDGWDDPRMPTIKGLRRRGYTREIINTFCRDIGVTRNENLVEYERLAAIARSQLHETAPRVMAVLRPLKVIVSGLEEVISNNVLEVPDFPFAPERGTHNVVIENEIYIDHADFRMEDSSDYYGLAPGGKLVGLKSACWLRCDSVSVDDAGQPTEVRATAVKDTGDSADKPKSTIQWVPVNTCTSAEVRVYGNLFVVDTPSDEHWEAELNPDSRVVYPDAKIDASIFKWKPVPETHYQFERIGFFVADFSSSAEPVANDESSKLIFNMTVSLKDSRPKAAGAPSRSRKEEQAKQLADKQAKMNLDPKDMFTGQTDLYSKFDGDGIPTHDAAGEPLSKSGIKKLKKDWDKQKRTFEANAAK
jgi:glutaminyl-tRNA synthetase